MSRPDLSAVLSHYEVRHNPDRMGNQPIKCPIHDDRMASAAVHLERQLWHCMACGVGGSSFDLIMQKEGVDFAGAVSIAEGHAWETCEEVSRGTGRTDLGLPVGSGSKRRDGGAVPAWPGFGR